MSQRFGDIGDIRVGSLQNRGERVSGSIGRDIPESELFADFGHPLVDSTGQVLRFKLQGKCILRVVEIDHPNG